MKNTLESLEWRYAVKKFDKKTQLSSEQINAVKNAFNLSPSSYGLQPYKLVVVQDKALKEKLLPASFGQQQISQAAAVLVFAVRTDFDQAFIDRYFDLVSETRKISLDQLAAYKNFVKGVFDKKSKEEIYTWAVKQVYLSMGHMLASLAFMKIDSCPMEGIDPSAYDQVLGLEAQGLKTVVAMPIGVRDQEDPVAFLPKVRKEISEIIVDA